ncbi:MAG TPA: D-alanyl-D-alanine carboxypeptidase/D-alanyl-D-alanine-endopeptidase [Gemmatimonadaceae bacterium]|jgi:D-alanyl-D-alanine carboxypeptidase/D-alanyl-D-alanine-endopeptidase (penicillin-binding protein 4)
MPSLLRHRGIFQWCAAAVVLAVAIPQLPAQANPAVASVRAATGKTGGTNKRRTASKHRRVAGRTPAKVRTAAKKRVSAPAPITFTAPRGGSQLVIDLDNILDRASRSGAWGVAVLSLDNGDTLFTRNADRQLLPASTMKLFTAAVALERFGANYRFVTEVLREGALGGDGTVRGNLVLRGAGDPSFSRRFSDGASGETPMAAMARLVAEAGVRRVSGDVIGDASAFEDRGVPEGWRSRYLGASYAARVSALSYSENLLKVTVKPAGKSAAITFEPALSGITIVNAVRVVAGRGARIGIVQRENGIEVRGSVGGGGKGRSVQVVAEHPALITTAAFRAALEAQGISVGGPVRLGRAGSGVPRVTALPSAPLGELITTMNGESNNHFAELLFRNAARSVGVVGSAENSNILLRRFLWEKAQVPPTDVYAADGSGLSTADRVTPRSMVQLLGYAARAPWRDVLEQSLPVAGRTETLRRRMKYTPAMGNLHAKTGTTNDVASLGGYVTSRDGERLAFSFIYNGRDRWRAKAAMDAMGATLANYQR